MFRIQVEYQGEIYHLNKTYSSGEIGNRIGLINVNENFTEYENMEAANEAIETFNRSNHHQRLENIEIIEVQ